MQRAKEKESEKWAKQCPARNDPTFVLPSHLSRSLVELNVPSKTNAATMAAALVAVVSSLSLALEA